MSSQTRNLFTGIKNVFAAIAYPQRAYRRWIHTYEAITPQLRAELADDILRWPSRPLISVIMPSYNIQPKWMKLAIDAVRNQIYPHWQLCISDDASTLPEIRPLLECYAASDARIRVIFRKENGHISVNSNSALDLATGDFVALMDADDLISEDALFWVAREIVLHPEVDLLFSDEDKIDADGVRFDPYLKSAWNPALMLSQNAFCHLGVYRRSLVEQVGRFRKGYEGAQDHDLVLRCAATTETHRIRHIPRLLYHWRALPSSTAGAAEAKNYSWEAGRAAIVDYLKGEGINAPVRPALKIFYQVDYQLPQPNPLVTIVVPTTLSNLTSARCLHSVLKKTEYGNFELLLVARSDHLRGAERKIEFAHLLTDSRVRLIDYGKTPFNFSWVCNLGARSARGDYFCFLNDDVEVITEDWLEQLVARAALAGVGAVGAMLYYPTDKIQHAGVLLGPGGVADHAFRGHRRGYLGHFGRAGLEQDFSCATAACVLIPREVFEHVGGFDEQLPVAFNDVDLCIRIRRTGARIIWTPTVEMYHHESFTFGRHDSPARSKQFRHDVRLMRQRWKDVLETDPCYNPNLGIVPGSMGTLAWPPRLPDTTQIVRSYPRTSISRTSDLTF